MIRFALGKRGMVAVLVFAVVGGVWSSAPAGRTSRKASKIVKKYITAMGGMDNIRAHETRKFVGRAGSFGIELPFTVWMKRPNKSRLDMSLQGQPIVQAYDGSTAWWVNPFVGAEEPTEMPGEFAEAIKRWTEFEGPLVDYRKRGRRIEYVNKEAMESGGAAHHLKLVMENNDVWHVYIDSETYLETMRRYSQSFQGSTIEVTTYFGDYRDVDGVMLPFEIRGAGFDGSPYMMTFDSYETNADIEDEFFEMPKHEEGRVKSTGRVELGNLDPPR